MNGMPEYVQVPHTGPSIHAALASAAPDELPEFESEFRIALAEADEDFDLSRVNRVLDRWLGRLHIRLNPPTETEKALVARVAAGDFHSFPASPTH